MNSGPGRDSIVVTRRKRHGVAPVVEHVELADILRLGAVFPFRLDIDLPLAAEAVEVVDEVAAHEGLKGLVDLSQVDALLEHLVPVHLDEELGHSREKGCRHAGQFGPLARRLDELVDVLCQESDVFARPVLENEGGAAGQPDALDGRRRKGKGNGLGQLGQFPVQVRHDGLVLLLRLFSLLPFFQCHKEKTAVGVLSDAHQAEPDDRLVVFDARGVLEDLLDLSARLVRALKGGGIGQGHVDEHVSLVLFGQESRGNSLAEKTGKDRDPDKKEKAEGALPDQAPAHADIALGGPAEDTVERPEKGAQRTPRLFPGLEEEGAEGRAEGQGVEGRDENRDGDGHGKLLVEPAGDARV